MRTRPQQSVPPQLGDLMMCPECGGNVIAPMYDASPWSIPLIAANQSGSVEILKRFSCGGCGHQFALVLHDADAHSWISMMG